MQLNSSNEVQALKMFQNVRSYCDKTTIHGFKYIGEQNRHLTEKCVLICLWNLSFNKSFLEYSGE